MLLGSSVLGSVPTSGSDAPDPPTLTIEDNADNTGATATIADSASGSSNAVYVASWGAEAGTVTAWAEEGTRTGNGSVALELAPGFYWAFALSTSGGSSVASQPVYFIVTSGLTAVHYRCLLATQSKIRGLALSGLASDSVVVRKLPLDRKLGANTGETPLPAVLVTPVREVFKASPDFNLVDYLGKGVQVTIVAADNQEATLLAGLDVHLLWRERIERAFRFQRLPGVSEIVNCSIEPGDLVGVQAWKDNLLASGLVLRFQSKEGRGI